MAVYPTGFDNYLAQQMVDRIRTVYGEGGAREAQGAGGQAMIRSIMRNPDAARQGFLESFDKVFRDDVAYREWEATGERPLETAQRFRKEFDEWDTPNPWYVEQSPDYGDIQMPEEGDYPARRAGNARYKVTGALGPGDWAVKLWGGPPVTATDSNTTYSRNAADALVTVTFLGSTLPASYQGRYNPSSELFQYWRRNGYSAALFGVPQAHPFYIRQGGLVPLREIGNLGRMGINFHFPHGPESNPNMGYAHPTHYVDIKNRRFFVESGTSSKTFTIEDWERVFDQDRIEELDEYRAGILESGFYLLRPGDDRPPLAPSRRMLNRRKAMAVSAPQPPVNAPSAPPAKKGMLDMNYLNKRYPRGVVGRVRTYTGPVLSTQEMERLRELHDPAGSEERARAGRREAGPDARRPDLALPRLGVEGFPYATRVMVDNPIETRLYFDSLLVELEQEGLTERERWEMIDSGAVSALITDRFVHTFSGTGAFRRMPFDTYVRMDDTRKQKLFDQATPERARLTTIPGVNANILSMLKSTEARTILKQVYNDKNLMGGWPTSEHHRHNFYVGRIGSWVNRHMKAALKIRTP